MPIPPHEHQNWRLAAPPTVEFEDVEDEDGQPDDEALSGLDAVNPRDDVDGVGGEHGQHPHVHVVQETCRRRSQDVSHHSESKQIFIARQPWKTFQDTRKTPHVQTRQFAVLTFFPWIDSEVEEPLC